ncbi:hypothetical protein IJ670_02940 [bacterium]|nr:hypothetical protein [bacterium]
MRHCNSVFSAEDIWYLLDSQNRTKRRLYLATCPICQKKMVLYSYFENNMWHEQYFYSGGAKRIKEKYKKEVTSTMLGFKSRYKAPFGFKYGKNIEVKKNGQIVGLKQYACDFWGNKILVKKIENGE